MTVRTRFAPSPTGYLHVGGARTALFSWLHARKHGGQFILRIEDTDLERSTPEAVNAILEGMAWLGLEYDEGPFYQTHHFDRYRAVAKQMLDDGHAYHCYCSKDELERMREEQMARKEKPRYDGRCRDMKTPPPPGVAPVVRFRNPQDGEVVVDDLVRGRVVFQNQELDDLIIVRSDGTPTYNFTVVVDDIDMKITSVIRGDDHLNNTPRQMNIMRVLGWTPPTYAHLPMILGSDGAKLSKRHGAVSVMQYHEDGFLPEALLNYLVRLGWSHGDDEVFSIDQMIQLFDVDHVNKSASAFNNEKLLWLNQHYIKNQDPARIAHYLSHQMAKLGIDPTTGPRLIDVIVAQRERAKTLVEMAQNSQFFYREFENYDAVAAQKNLTKESETGLTDLRDFIAAMTTWSAEAIHHGLTQVAEKHGQKLGKVAQPFRVAITGGTVSPPIDVTACLIGRERVIARLNRAIALIGGKGT